MIHLEEIDQLSIYLPGRTGDCPEEHPAGWRCSRYAGHSGRHVATGAMRRDKGRPVYAVWTNLQAVEPCS